MSKLYIVATPIGNLADITFRAVEVLKAADLIACEDTRVSKKLLDHYQIKSQLISYHQHSQPIKTEKIIEELKDGRQVAVITDAGTPGIADPGNQLVAHVHRQLGQAVQIITIPGATAITAALAIAGLPTDRFLFLGFLPHKKGKETMLKVIAASETTVGFYESTHRIIKTLEKLADYLDNSRPLVVCRELTKKFETIYRGHAREILQQLKSGETRGEFVVIVGGKRKTV